MYNLLRGETVEHITEYKKWLNSPYIDQNTKEELLDIQNDQDEIKERFCTCLEFGTAGLRGLMGAGTNRMNEYTVGRAAQGLANHINSLDRRYAERGVAIAYDSRRFSYEFALRTALVLNANGIRAYLFDDIRPTPLLSFAVRELEAAAGIVITASHNPAGYNGFKVYWEDGGQITQDRASRITYEIYGACDFCEVPVMDKEKALGKGMLKIVGDEIDKKYIDRVLVLCLEREMIRQNGEKLGIVYTPLHGTGYRLVGSVLAAAGFNGVNTVREQQEPHMDFPTVKSPNPEDRQALELAIATAVKNGSDIVVATDPDADRIGIAAKNKKGEFETFTGNQIGVLLAEYILSQRNRMGIYVDGDTVIKTIVTSELGRIVASSHGVDTIDTLTGFKYIGEKIEEFSRTREKNFVFGYEESNGYLLGDFVRDKDGIIATLLVCEMALFYKLKGITLSDVLEDLYRRYGYFIEDVVSIRLEGCEGLERTKGIMEYFRENKEHIDGILGEPVEEIRDYLHQVCYDAKGNPKGETGLPISDVLYFKLKDRSWVCIRPSGTEPKLKLYFSVAAARKEDAKERLKRLRAKADVIMAELMGGVLL